MNAETPFVDVPFARALPADRQPQRLHLTLPDGYATPAYLHEARGPLPGLPVLHVHGIQSHPGWFVGSASWLADRGRAVFQPTRRGSGANRLRPGHADSARQLLDDVEAACRFVLDRTGRSKLHLVGVSWGGKLLAAYATDPLRAASVASLTLVAPGIVPRVDLSIPAKLAVALSLPLWPRKSFAIPLNAVELFTDNEPMRRYLRDDPYRLHRATAALLYASRRLDGLLRRAPAGALRMPTTLLLARRDRIIDNARTLAAVGRLTAGGLALREFDACHVLEFQPDPAPFYQALAEALDRAEQAP